MSINGQGPPLISKNSENKGDPNVQFYKVKDVSKPKGFGYDKFHRFENEKLSSPNYRFLKSELMTLRIPCRFNFEDFPFDMNQCNITFFELRYFEKININIISMNIELRYLKESNIDIIGMMFENQKIYDGTESISMNIPKSPFEIFVTIGNHERWNFSGYISITLKRISLDLLLGSCELTNYSFKLLISYLMN